MNLIFEKSVKGRRSCILPKCKEIETALAANGILSGLPYEGGMLWCVTEKVSKETLDTVVSVVKEVLA